jgi:hypothetical protein
MPRAELRIRRLGIRVPPSALQSSRTSVGLAPPVAGASDAAATEPDRL